MPDYFKILKYNPYHDELGRFTSSNKSKRFSPDVVSNVGKARHLEYARVAALRVRNKAAKEEPGISKLLRTVVKDPLKLDGFDFRMKTLKSLTDKVDRDSKFEHLTEDAAATKIGDAVRYTVETPTAQYVNTVKSLMGALEKEGHQVAKFKNYWANKKLSSKVPIYQGINIQLESKTGQRWELQFHTAQSYETKEHLNHKMFEQYRKIPPQGHRTKAQDSLASELHMAMASNQARVLVPGGVDSLQY